MKRISFSKIVLVFLVVGLLGITMAGCITIPTIPTTGTVYLVVSGTYYYNLKMDGTTYFSNKTPGTYTITDVPIGNHFFEAVDIDGSFWGYDSENKYVSSGSNYVYLYP